MKQEDLFRREAISHTRSKWAGKALLISGLPAWAVVAISLSFILVLVIFITYGTYTRRISVGGEVTTLPRTVSIFATQQGFIAQRFVNVGEQVKQGQHLYQIDVSRVTDSGTVSSNTRQTIENQLAQVESIITKLEQNKKTTADNLRAQIEQYKLSHNQSKEMVENSRNGVKFMRETMRNYNEYRNKGLINRDQLNNQVYLYYQQQSTFQSLYSQSIQESLQITNLNSELVTRASDFDNQISQYQFQKNDLLRQLSEADASGSLIVNAPTDGRVESLSVTPGQMVNAGDSLTQLIPSNHAIYYLVLWLPNSSVPYVNSGDNINIRYDAFPFEKFGQFPGVIDKVAYVPVSNQEMSTYGSSPMRQNGELAESYYKVLVAIDNTRFGYQGKVLNLSSGMKAQATLFLEKRPIYQWMFAPFYDMKNSVSGPIREQNL
ncbi:HlyD family secretion protein [Serratia proteamaculans]|uniref:HlyD family secretion protein n=1 Tax=Serratia proteamaculans TaxID=28151 RepID=UPI0039AF37E2